MAGMKSAGKISARRHREIYQSVVKLGRLISILRDCATASRQTGINLPAIPFTCRSALKPYARLLLRWTDHGPF
jgi:hypothetical protein